MAVTAPHYCLKGLNVEAKTAASYQLNAPAMPSNLQLSAPFSSAFFSCMHGQYSGQRDRRPWAVPCDHAMHMHVNETVTGADRVHGIALSYSHQVASLFLPSAWALRRHTHDSDQTFVQSDLPFYAARFLAVDTIVLAPKSKQPLPPSSNPQSDVPPHLGKHQSVGSMFWLRGQ